MSSVGRPHGRLFQIRGPAAPKLLSPRLLCVRGTAHNRGDLCCVITDCPAVGRWKKAMSSMLRSGKDQNNERSESNTTLWYNFPLNYLQVLQVVSTFRARSTVPTSAVWTAAASCSDSLEQLRQCAKLVRRQTVRLQERLLPKWIMCGSTSIILH